MKKVNELIKKVQEDASRKLKSDRRTLISEVDSTKKSLNKTIRELDNYKKVKVPNLQREVLRLSQKIIIMEAIDAIKKIKTATYWQDVFSTLKEYKSEYRVYTLLLHPDKCKLDGAEEAFRKITEYKDFIEENMHIFKDDVGTVNYSDFSVTIEGDENYLKKSLKISKNYHL